MSTLSKTQLLCTFCNEEQLEETLHHIKSTYDVTFDSIYILESQESPTSLCCTYNINVNSAINGKIPDYTISLHRKKSTNTLYTINALNLLISELNEGRVDNNFLVPWENYKNVTLV